MTDIINEIEFAAKHIDDPRDWLPWDVSLTIANVPIIPKDRKLPEVNQSMFTETKMACTIVGAYKDACYTTGIEATQEGELWFAQQAHDKYNYVYGKGWYTWVAMNTVKKIWNERYPDHQLSYIAMRNDNPLFAQALLNNNILGCTYKGNAEYNKDYRKDNVLDGVEFWTSTYWHRPSITMRLKLENGKIMVVDNYDGVAYNIYELAHINDLIENKVFYPTFYLWIEEPKEEIKEEIKIPDPVKLKIDKETILELNILSNSLSLCWKHFDPEDQEKVHDLKVKIDEILSWN